MNPNTQQSLDPKLKEAYDRVMGSQINPQPAAPVKTQPQPQQHEIPSPSGPQPIININAGSSSTKTEKVQKAKGKGISPIVFAALGLLFFGGYTVIWLKVFKIF